MNYLNLVTNSESNIKWKNGRWNFRVSKQLTSRHQLSKVYSRVTDVPLRTDMSVPSCTRLVPLPSSWARVYRFSPVLRRAVRTLVPSHALPVPKPTTKGRRDGCHCHVSGQCEGWADHTTISLPSLAKRNSPTHTPFRTQRYTHIHTPLW